MSLVRAFGGGEQPVLLKGGQNTTYVSGNIVLKPVDDPALSNWMGDVLESLPDDPNVRFPRPIKSSLGTWIHEGYGAWTFLAGTHVRGEYDKKLRASVAFHALLKNVPKPDFIDVTHNSWSVANRIAWQQQEFQYDDEFMALYHRIKPHLKPLDVPCQLIHGDLSGNFLCDPNLAPAIIDFSPAWVPNGFAEGILFADAIAWEHADSKDLDSFFALPHFEQFAWRGVLRRIAEQAEHMKWFDKDREQAFEEAKAFVPVIEYLESMV